MIFLHIACLMCEWVRRPLVHYRTAYYLLCHSEVCMQHLYGWRRWLSWRWRRRAFGTDCLKINQSINIRNLAELHNANKRDVELYHGCHLMRKVQSWLVWEIVAYRVFYLDLNTGERLEHHFSDKDMLHQCAQLLIQVHLWFGCIPTYPVRRGWLVLRFRKNIPTATKMAPNTMQTATAMPICAPRTGQKYRGCRHVHLGIAFTYTMEAGTSNSH